MRLFTGIELPDEIVANLERLLAQLRPAAPIRWSPVRNLHITIKFIGEWPQERLEELKAALGGLPAIPNISVRIEKLGFFPNPHSPRVFWAGIQASPELANLAGETDRVLTGLGVEPEKRAYSPHLTLARIQSPARLADLLHTIAQLPSFDFGRFEADRFYLYWSRSGAGGSVYSKVAECPLMK